MIENNLFEEDRGCGKIPVMDMKNYILLTFEAERGNDSSSYINDLIQKNYGQSLKDIDMFFQGHFLECYLCNEIYQDKILIMRELDKPEGFKEFLEERVVEFTDVKIKVHFPENLDDIARRYKNLAKRFSLEHLDLDREAYNLKFYIMTKAVKEKGYWCKKRLIKKEFKPNKNYEEHIKKCSYCQEFEKIAKDLNSMITF